jgi:carnitine O-acetyltransferase
MYSLIQREMHAQSSGRGSPKPAQSNGEETVTVPEIFTDPGYTTMATSVLSTSNCGNPALRLFGFGPVTPEGYGIGEPPPTHTRISIWVSR